MEKHLIVFKTKVDKSVQEELILKFGLSKLTNLVYVLNGDLETAKAKIKELGINCIIAVKNESVIVLNN